MTTHVASQRSSCTQGCWAAWLLYLVSLVATNTTGLGASPWLTFCLLMTDWEVVLIPEVYGLPLAGYGTPVTCGPIREQCQSDSSLCCDTGRG